MRWIEMDALSKGHLPSILDDICRCRCRSILDDMRVRSRQRVEQLSCYA